MVDLVDARPLYGGTAAAVWVNLTTAASGSGAPTAGAVGTIAQLAVLAGATATVVGITWWSRSLPLLIAASWALVAIAIKSSQSEQPLLVTAAIVGLVVLAATGVIRRVSGSVPVV